MAQLVQEQEITFSKKLTKRKLFLWIKKLIDPFKWISEHFNEEAALDMSAASSFEIIFLKVLELSLQALRIHENVQISI